MARILVRRRGHEGGSRWRASVADRRIAPGARGFSWTSEGTILAGSLGGALFQFPADGGAATTVAKAVADGRELRWPQPLPGGRAVLVTAAFNEPDAGDVMVLDLETGMRRALIPGGIAARYVPPEYLTFVRGGDIWAARFDPIRLEVLGNPVVIERGVRVDENGAPHLALAGDGTLTYVPGDVTGYSSRTLVWVDRRGREEALNVPVRPYRYARLSPDGSRIAVEIQDRVRDIWIWDVNRETLTRMTFDGGNAPAWTPDAARVTFSRDRKIYWQSADGSGTPEALADSPTQGRSEIYVRPFPDVDSGRWQISTSGGTRPAWSSNGRELFFLPVAGTVMAVQVLGGVQTFAAGRQEAVIRGDYIADAVGRTYSVSPDGNRFLMIKAVETTADAARARIVVVQNWIDELKRLLPAN